MSAAQPASRHASAAVAIVQEHAALAMAASMVPVPFVEFAAVSAVHLKMIEDLSRHYGREFRAQSAKAIVGATLSGCASYYLDSIITATLAKFVPGLGSLVALITLPSIAGGITYALGRVYIRHFETGGSLLDFDYNKIHTGFLQEIERIRANPAELAQIIGARTAFAAPR